MILEGCARRVFHGGYTHVRVILPEDFCNRSPGFSALVLRKETTSSLPVGCPTDGLSELSQEHCPMGTAVPGVVLLLAAEVGPALAGSPFRLNVPHQASILSPLPEFHGPGYPGPYLPGPADAQRLCKNDVGKDEGSLGVPNP